MSGEAYPVAGYYAHDAIHSTADVLRGTPDVGSGAVTGSRREATARVCDEVSALVRLLAYDVAFDAELTDEQWASAVQRVQDAAGALDT